MKGKRIEVEPVRVRAFKETANLDHYNGDIRFYDTANGNTLLGIVKAWRWKTQTSSKFLNYVFVSAYYRSNFIAVYIRKTPRR